MPWITTSSSSSMAFLVLAYLVVVSIGNSNAQLTKGFYSSSCPKLESTVRSVVHSAIKKEARMGASILRLFFHDCFVNGCDGSLLLDDTPTFTGEKMSPPNNGSVRGFEVIDQIKSAVERVCPGIVSCADVLAISARDSVVSLGGPSWNVKLGRRDARTASSSAANASIPPPTSSLSALIKSFSDQGLSTTDMVALSGAHTIGQARCTTFRTRIYNENNIDASFAKTKQATCPSTNNTGDNNLAPLDIQTPTCFDNKYYNNLVNQKGLLHSDQQLFSGGSTNALVQTYSSNPSDQQLFSGGSTNALVQTYSSNPKRFYADFITAMNKMGDIKPLTGSNGEIRKNCRRMN